MIKTALIAIYAVVTWGGPNGSIKWHEFQLSQHFFSVAHCEAYLHNLVYVWTLDPEGVFHDLFVAWERDPRTKPPRPNVVSERCGAWVPDSDLGQKL